MHQQQDCPEVIQPLASISLTSILTNNLPLTYRTNFSKLIGESGGKKGK